MSVFASSQFLSRVMWVDAASCAATAALQLVAARPLAALTGLPVPLLWGTGLFLLIYAYAAIWIARREPTPRMLVGVVAVGNLGWTLACGVLVWSGLLPLTFWGKAWVLAQALVVVVLAELQWEGLRHTRAALPMAHRMA
mgnify:CR=1 FL=1